MPLTQACAPAGNAVVDGIAASNHVINLEPGLVIIDALAWERLKYMVRTGALHRLAAPAPRCALLQVGEAWT